MSPCWGSGEREGRYRDQGAFGVDQEQQVRSRGDPAVGRVGDDAGAGGVAGSQGRAGPGGAGNAEPPGHRDRGQAVQGDGGDDDQEGDGQDLGRAADVAGGQRGPEGRGGGRGDDAARRHPAGERAFPPGQLGPDGGEEGDQRAGHYHQDGHQGEGGQHEVLQRRRRHGGRDGHEQDPDDQLNQGLEERPFGRDVEDAQVRHREPHQDRGDEPGVVADDVAGGRHPHHASQLARGGEQIVQIKLAQAQPTAPPRRLPRQLRRCRRTAGTGPAGGRPRRWCSPARRGTRPRPRCRRPG